jgi:hypothetical protein
MVTWAILPPHTLTIDLKPELPDRRTEVYPEPPIWDRPSGIAHLGSIGGRLPKWFISQLRQTSTFFADE